MIAAAAPVMALARPYADGPPPGYTGDFGEPTCATCHMDAPVEPAGTALSIGVPGHYEPGRAYRVTVAVRHAGMGAAGFQLAARNRSGAQAGRWRALDDRVRLSPDTMSGVVYASHSVMGTALVAPDSARWDLEWTAPEQPADTVIFSAAANATNADDSNFGDHIYVGRTSVPAIRCRAGTPGGAGC